ncbi:ABC transporter permease [Bifidobacterium xylocopae]|uniref:ABC transporter permease n=1 Tax=Bifidobacterium xylocopae TaxID=2493119 RepID=A0A366KG27_9BIFI|nr:ABC transporter permease [Bifidobacterium xylocopae]RBQ00129.1 ABC transporter permease [Bifidobacterium xylocopae]
MHAGKSVAGQEPPGGESPTSSRLRRAWQRARFVVRAVWAQGEGRFAMTVLCLWILVSLVCLAWTPWPLWATDGYRVWQTPSRAHPLGTDGTGADVLSWLLAGSATNLAICLLTVVLAGALGSLLLAATVSRTPALAGSSTVVVDALISIPTVLIALILAVPMGSSALVIVLACGIGYGLNLARVARPAALLAAGSDYALSALSSGASGWRILTRHILPNALPAIAVQLSLSAGSSVLAEAGLTYLGVGVPSGLPSWGHSLTTSVRLVNVYPLTVLWPGLVVTIVVVSLNLFGDALREAIDPASNPALRQEAV